MSRLATNITLIDQSLVSGTNFMTGLLLANFLGIRAYGIFVLLQGITLFCLSIHNAVVISPLMALGPQKAHKDSSSYYQSALILQFLIIGGILALLVLGFILGNELAPSSEYGKWVVPLSLATAGLLAQEYFRRYFFTTKSSQKALVNDLISYGLQLTVIILYQLSFGLDISSCLYIISITSLLAVIHGIISSELLRKRGTINPSVVLDTAREHWQYGNWLIARNTAYWVSTQMVIYATGIFLSIVAVGAMGAARNIVGVANILFLAVDNFATPRAAVAYKEGGIKNLKVYIRRISILGGALTGILVAIIVLAPEFWLQLIYSEEYNGFGWVVITWAIFYLIGYFQRPTGIALRVLKNTKDIFRGTVYGAIISTLLVYPLMQIAGLAGAMTTLIVVQLTISFMYFKAYQKETALRS